MRVKTSHTGQEFVLFVSMIDPPSMREQQSSSTPVARAFYRLLAFLHSRLGVEESARYLTKATFRLLTGSDQVLSPLVWSVGSGFSRDYYQYLFDFLSSHNLLVDDEEEEGVHEPFLKRRCTAK